MITNVRPSMLALAALEDWYISQNVLSTMACSTRDLYIEQPIWFAIPGLEHYSMLHIMVYPLSPSKDGTHSMSLSERTREVWAPKVQSRHLPFPKKRLQHCSWYYLPWQHISLWPIKAVVDAIFLCAIHALNGSAETLEFLSKCILLAKVVLLSMMHLD